MGATYKTMGIVLRRMNLGEADRIVTFFTPERGKIKAVVKGARRIKSRLSGHIELFSESGLMLAVGRNLDVVTSARLQRHYGAITDDYDSLMYGHLFNEMTDKLSEEGESHPEVYSLLLETYTELEQGRASNLTELYFKLRLLNALGYRPHLESCVVCGSDSAREYWFDPELGGIVDAACKQAPAVPVSLNAIKLWRLALVHDVSVLRGVAGVDAASQESLAACNGFYDYIFGRKFKSLELKVS